jgi:hypothetical protein
VYVWLHARVCMYVCMHARVCMYVCMHARVCMYVCMHARVYVCMRACIHIVLDSALSLTGYCFILAKLTKDFCGRPTSPEP